MFSQYTWGDFFTFILALAIPYYAFVIWKYYRQDIREWILSRGRNDAVSPATATSEEDDDASDLYSVSHYASDLPQREPVISKTTAAPAPDPVPQGSPYQAQQPTNQPGNTSASEPDLAGMALDEDDSPDFHVPILIEADQLEERSLADVIKAAQRVTTDEAGVLSPVDSTDVEASNLADVVNQQQAKKALSGISFNR